MFHKVVLFAENLYMWEVSQKGKPDRKMTIQ